MKKSLWLTCAFCAIAANASAFDFNPYVSAKAKYAFARNEIKYTGVDESKIKINDDVWGGSVAFGTIYPLIDGDFRLELEYTKNADAEKKHNNRTLKVKTQGVLVNAYYDFNLRTMVPIKPYVGIGFGWGQSKFNFGGHEVKDDGASMQIGGGMNYAINRQLDLDLGYRYITYGDFDKTYRIPGYYYEKADYKPRAHEISLGFRYKF